MITTVERTSAQIITATSEPGTRIEFNNVISNDLGCTSYPQDVFPGFYQFPNDGVSILYNGTYLITANVSFPASGSGGQRYMAITAYNTVTGSGFAEQYTSISAIPRSQVGINTTVAYSLSATVSWRLFVNTLVRMEVWHTNATGTISTAVANTAAGTLNASLSAALILQ